MNGRGHPRAALARNVRPSSLVLGLTAVAFLATSGLDRAFPLPVDGSVLIVVCLTLLGAATLVMSLAVSIIQGAVANWPAYLYVEIGRDPGLKRIMSLILAGILLGLASLAGQVLANLPVASAAVLTALLTGATLVLLIDYVFARIAMFDPLELVRQNLGQMHRLRTRLGGPRRSVARAVAVQEQYLAALNRSLGMSRWLAEQDRPFDAIKAFENTVAEVSGYSTWRASRPAAHFCGYWDRSSERDQLTKAYLPPSSVPYFHQQWSRPSAIANHPSGWKWRPGSGSADRQRPWRWLRTRCGWASP